MQSNGPIMKQASCVFLVNLTIGKVVLTTRRGSTQVGLPGGKVDPGETPAQAAQRELLEETGINISITESDMFYSAVCAGEVDYDTFCFFKEFTGEIPGGIEDDIDTRWGSVNELLMNSPFALWNYDMLLAFHEKFFKRAS